MSPMEGTIPPGGNTPVEITVDADGFDSGEYDCDLVVSSTDYDDPEIVVPVSLTIVWTGVEEGSRPDRVALHPNVPNPFNPATVISYDVPSRMPLRLAVYDVAGRRVRVLLDDAVLDPGRHTVAWDGRGENGAQVASGVYFYRLLADGQVLSRRPSSLSRGVTGELRAAPDPSSDSIRRFPRIPSSRAWQTSMIASPGD